MYVEDPGDGGFDYSEALTQEGSNDNYTTTFNKDDDTGAHGEYALRATAYNQSNGAEIGSTSDITITLDGKNSSITFPSSEYVKEDPTITVEISDQHSDVVSVSASADNDASVSSTNFDSCSAGSTCEADVEIDTSELSSGDSFTLSVDAEDEVGNQGSKDQNFDFDTSYEGDSSAEFEFDDGYIYEMEDDSDDFEFEVTLGDSSDEDLDIYLKCYAGDADDEDNLLTETDSKSVGEDGEDFSCEIPAEDDYTDESVDVVVKAYDEAGNSQEVGEITYVMDLNAPIVTDFESSADTSNYNEDFEMTFEASDSATSVEEAEYFFDDELTEEGEGTSIDNPDEGSFTVDTSSLEKGEHTIYVRAKDEAGRWSGMESYEFNFYPNAEPSISLTAPGPVEMTATEQSELEFNVENTGRLMIDGVDLQFSGLFSDSASVGELAPGEDINVPKSFTPEESDIGNKNLQVTAEDFNVSRNIEVRVKASESQQESINSRLETYQSRLEALKSNTSSLKSKLNPNLRSRLESNVSSFESDVQEAENAVNAGEYYRAQEALSSIDADYSAAKTSYEEVKTQHQKNQQRTVMMGVIAAVLLLAVGGGAFAYHEGVFDDYDFDSDLDLQVVSDKLGDLGGSSGEEEGEDEFDWDGFN